MKKHELLKFAYDNYPKGTKFKQERCEEIRTASGNYAVNNVTVYDIDLDLALYIYSESNEEWAEIVKPKIAVKVENEKEFKVLMKYYDSLGYVWNGGDKPLSKESLVCYPNAIKFEDKFQHSVEKESIGYQIIPFSAFAKDHNIKLPLILSEDNVWLYEDSDIYIVWKDNSIWEYDNNHKGFKSSNGEWYVNPEANINERKLFSTKQAALDWIEAQKPKTIEYVSNFGIKCQSSKNEVLLNCGCGCFSLTVEDIEAIHKAMQELS